MLHDLRALGDARFEAPAVAAQGFRQVGVVAFDGGGQFRRLFIQAAIEFGRLENVGENLVQPVLVLLFPFGNAQDGLRHDAFAWLGDQGVPGTLQDLVFVVGNKHRRVVVQIMVDAVIVDFAGVAIPVAQQHLDRHERQKAGQVQHFGEPLLEPVRVRFPASLSQAAQVLAGGVILVVVDNFQRRIHVRKGGLAIKVAPGVFKVARKEIAVFPLLNHVHTQAAAIELHHRMGGAGEGDIGGVEDLAAQPFAQKGGVLHRVVQVELLQPVEQSIGFIDF